jgi:hypothetical protein
MRWFLHNVPLGSQNFGSTRAQDESDYGPLMPTDNHPPCACGSTNRVYNNQGNCFCRRCGRRDESITVPTFTTLRGL